MSPNPAADVVSTKDETAGSAPPPTTSRMGLLLPAPVAAHPVPAQDFTITASTAVHADGPAGPVGRYLAELLRPPTGFPLPVRPAGAVDGAIVLRLDAPDGQHPEEYRLSVDRRSVTLAASTPAGLFAGVQTLRQLLPAEVEGGGSYRGPHPGPWIVAGGEVRDHPRFAHRGAMLDVSRHFFTVAEVKRFIDQIVRYKINVLHLHLTDDQSWRIEIQSWPRLATYGGSTQVGGGPGGYYTQLEYRDLVAYAAARHVTVVPEIDVPGHVHAALASYPELNADGVAPPLFTTKGTAVGFSSLCTDREITYRFVDDVLREVAALTPGEYLHLGTDEAHATPEDGYVTFLNRVLPMVAGHGKTVIGWHELLRARPPASAIPQYWGRDTSAPLMAEAVARGNRVILSPADKVYLDMKYDLSTPIGFKWAGCIDVADIYGWDPGTYLDGVPEAAVHGIEAPLWSETLNGYADVEYMAFPRLPALAELAWSPWSTHDWAGFARRLAAQGPGWAAHGVNFYRSPQISWPE